MQQYRIQLELQEVVEGLHIVLAMVEQVDIHLVQVDITLYQARVLEYPVQPQVELKHPLEQELETVFYRQPLSFLEQTVIKRAEVEAGTVVDKEISEADKEVEEGLVTLEMSMELQEELE